MRFKLTGKVFSYLGVVFVGLAFAGIGAISYSQIRKEYVFDLTQRLNVHSENLERLDEYCTRKDRRYCFDAVSARSAWDSAFADSQWERLERGCAYKDQRACKARDALKNAKKTDSVWLQSSGYIDAPRAGDGNWPRIRVLERPVSYRQWLEYSYEGFLPTEHRQTDIVCGGSIELTGAMVCVTYGNVNANLALGRIAHVIEQGGGVRTLEEHRTGLSLRFWQGYNLLRNDFDSASAKIESESDTFPEEKRMWKFLRERDWQYLLTFNAFSVIAGIPSHEFLHALYFSSQEYRDIVMQAISSHKWKMLPLRFFAESLYKTDNEYVILNEMQAYALQSVPLFERTDWNDAVAVLLNSLNIFKDQNTLLKSILTER